MLPWHGTKWPLVPLFLSLLLTTWAGQDSLEDVDVDDESNSVSTESPVSSASMPMWRAPVFMHKGTLSCGFLVILRACGIMQGVKATVIFVFQSYGKSCLMLNFCGVSQYIYLTLLMHAPVGKLRGFPTALIDW